MKAGAACIACKAPAEHTHHVVPTSLIPNDGVVPLCGRCHGLVHALPLTSSAALTSKALQAKRARGERTGSVSYGFTLAADGVALLDNPAELATIARARALRASGLSLRKVATELAFEGRRARNGGVFEATQIARMVD